MEEPGRPPIRRGPGTLVGALAIVAVLGIVVVLVAARRCTRTGKEWTQGLDALRTDKTWRHAYREMHTLDAGAFVASFHDLDDPMHHERMGHGVVLRGRVQRVDLRAADEPVLVQEAGPGAVRCLFDARRSDRLETLQEGQIVGIGGALRGVVAGDPELIACHFEAEWR